MIDFYKKNKVLCLVCAFLVLVLIIILLIPTKKIDNPIPSKNEIIFAKVDKISKFILLFEEFDDAKV